MLNSIFQTLHCVRSPTTSGKIETNANRQRRSLQGKVQYAEMSWSVCV